MIKYTLLLFLLIGCGNTTNQDSRSITTFEFNVSNSNVSMFGRKVYADGEVAFVSSLCKSGNVIYFVDPIHCNVKSVDSNSGKLTVSNRLSSKQIELTDIAVHQQRVLVLTDSGIYYSLSLDLSESEVKQTSRDDRWGDRKFIIYHGNLFIFSESTDVIQDKNDFHMSINALRVKNDHDLDEDTLRLGKGYRVYEQVRDGFLLKEDGKCLQNDQFEICLEERFPVQQCSYSCRNIFADSVSVSFFEFRNNKFRIVTINVL